MPTQSISPGPLTMILQNIAYALPARRCMVLSAAAVEVSADGTTWTALTGANTVGAEAVGAFIRCPTGNTTLTCKVS